MQLLLFPHKFSSSLAAQSKRKDIKAIIHNAFGTNDIFQLFSAVNFPKQFQKFNNFCKHPLDENDSSCKSPKML